MAAPGDEASRVGPYPDDELPEHDPAARYPAAESVSLAFVAALQDLPPWQRAALLLRDVLGFGAGETAEILGCGADAVAATVARARAALPPPGAAPPPGSAAEGRVVAAFTVAFERGDAAGVVALLTEDAWLWMPPLPFGCRGRRAAGHFLAILWFRRGARRFRLVPTRANGQPAFGCYERDAGACGLIVLTLAAGRISAIACFPGDRLLARFGLPRTLPP